jgi:hypothetical protein
MPIMRAMMNSRRGETDAGVGQSLEIERELRIAHVHADLDRRLRHRIHREVDHFDLELAADRRAGIAFRTAYRHLLAFGQLLGGIAATDDRGDAELARDDRCVARCARRDW